MNVAIIENDVVVNVIIADSLEIANSLTKLESVDADLLNIMVGSLRINEKWYPPKPDENWVWHDLAEKWINPEEIEAEKRGEITILTASQEKELLAKCMAILKKEGIDI